MSVKEQSRLTAMQLLLLQAIQHRPRCRPAVKEDLDYKCGVVCRTTFNRACRSLINGGYMESIVHSATRSQFQITDKGKTAIGWFENATVRNTSAT